MNLFFWPEINRDIKGIGFGCGGWALVGRWVGRFGFDERASEAVPAIKGRPSACCMHSHGLQFQTLFFTVQKLGMGCVERPVQNGELSF